MLENKLKEIISGVYPFHMPGHKRQKEWLDGLYDLDITEISGADDLHAPKGIILDAQKRAAQFFDTRETFFVTGGATAGVLAAISAACYREDRILIARNCHKSVYNAARVSSAKVSYIFPETDETLGVYGYVSPKAVAEEMEKSGAKIVVITSPTYEGIVSDIEKIAKEVHMRDGILIVDSAHGAHLGLGDYFPKSARNLGADAVIESAHKTLPCLTGAALVQLCSNRITSSSLQRALSVFESSSPPYPILCSIDRFITAAKSKDLFTPYGQKLEAFYQKAACLKHIRICRTDDPSKIVISVKDTNINGFKLKEMLLAEYKIELEMAMPSYAIAMTSLADTEEGFSRLFEALSEIDRGLKADIVPTMDIAPKPATGITPRPIIRRPLTEKRPKNSKSLLFKDSIGSISCEFIYAYPPGSPILAPGEEITPEILSYVELLSACGAQILSTDPLFPKFITVFDE